MSGFPWQPLRSAVDTVSLRYGVPPELILAVVAAESSFNPNAFRAEPQINDASRGLMQVLYTTARGLGYTGTPGGLFDPAISLDLGTKLLGQNLRARGGDVAAAISQYNGGYRPSQGFGARLNGTFANQAHVDRVLGYLAGFQAALRAPTTPGTGGGSSGGSPEASNALAPWIVLLGLLAGFLLWRGAR